MINDNSYINKQAKHTVKFFFIYTHTNVKILGAVSFFFLRVFLID